MHLRKMLAAGLLLGAMAWSPASQATVLFTDGPINGTTNGFFIDGPNAGPFTQSIYDTFTATGSGKLGELDVGLWVPTGNTPTTLTWWLGTAWLDNSIGGGTAALTAANSTFLFSNGVGYDIFDVKLTGLTSSLLSAGSNYVLTLGNANDSAGSQFVAWDDINGPATCQFAVGNSPVGGCGSGGQAFTLISQSTTSVPEPSTMALFGAGLLGFRALRKKRRKTA